MSKSGSISKVPCQQLKQQYQEQSDTDRRSVLERKAFGDTYPLLIIKTKSLYTVRRIFLGQTRQMRVEDEILRKECAILRGLCHPNIMYQFPPFRPYSSLDPYFEVVMESVDGERSLKEKIVCESPGVPTEWEIVEWGRQMASALSYMHKNGVLHRDLRPENVLLTKEGEIKLSAMNLRSVAAVCTCSLYASPERAAGAMNYDGRDDVWAAGCILLELLARNRLAYNHRGFLFFNGSPRREAIVAEDAAPSPWMAAELLPRMMRTGKKHRCSSSVAHSILEKCKPNLLLTFRVKTVVATLCRVRAGIARYKALNQIDMLAVDKDTCRMLVAAGAIAPLLRILRRG